MFQIEELCVEVEGAPILKGLSLTVKPGEIHAIMGPNGAGKSTLAKVVGGHPAYEITAGHIRFNGEDLADLEPEERARLGLFIGFQYPIEIPGVTNTDFLHAAYQAVHGKLSRDEFEALLQQKMERIRVPAVFAQRGVNEGFSGGEKKRNEILQMALLDPKLAILDETDSGLDIDALKIVADGVNSLMEGQRSLILITHYQRLLNYIKPDYVHVMVDGRIAESGGAELAQKLEAEGYEWAT
ncbi:MAG: Fe-S cluster assembly ATPase SufC [Parachlamydiales bacterium]